MYIGQVNRSFSYSAGLLSLAQFPELLSEKHEVTGSSPVPGTSIGESNLLSLLFCPKPVCRAKCRASAIYSSQKRPALSVQSGTLLIPEAAQNISLLTFVDRTW